MSSKVYIGNLGRDPLPESDLEEEFEDFGPIKEIFVARNPPGFAYIDFMSEKDAKQAVREMSGKKRSAGAVLNPEKKPNKPRKKTKKEKKEEPARKASTDSVTTSNSEDAFEVAVAKALVKSEPERAKKRRPKSKIQKVSKNSEYQNYRITMDITPFKIEDNDDDHVMEEVD
ncbi:Oidioi.mRNA.OKI2018_I69.XSR.g16429.t1.cds [Oikopleura dioica]|uniref:Oidioi.mRNA.OKI2018_I69.XSR.g16429.t1.cds n=1 Tax=Oikopleura dioica TaxID=34765 RepID=A0ABN7SL60_OIKDI|nr:Oidioi.mRNA.OKI2018_I69.XSR.g16429.t1.cds [Oikopleura dioica]